MHILTTPWSSRKLVRGAGLAAAGAVYAPCVAFLMVSLQALAVAGERFVLPRLQDDAFYYLVIAKELAASGRSDFTPGIATNGYQPLWMLAVWAMGSVFGWAVSTVKALDLLTIFCGLALFVWLFRLRSALASFFYCSALWYLLETFAINGMESSLLFPGMLMFVGACLSAQPWIAAHRTPLLFWSAAFCIGARLDAALFLLPVLAVAPVSRRARLQMFGALAACGLLYAAANQAIFGSALPVSGAVKSLGGLQLNHVYFTQIVRELTPERVVKLRSAATPYLVGVLVFGVALLLRRRHPAPVRLLAAALVGLLLFGAKLAFLSSWGVWTWYAFPTLFFALVAIWMIETSAPQAPIVRVAQAVFGAALAVTQLQSVLADRSSGFAGLNRRFIEDNAELLAGETIAMGDRAGSFAFDYPGGVYQLEGLVNSAAYVGVLKDGGDLRPHLCQAGIRIVVSYEVPLGDYAQHRIDALQPQLTSYPGPYLMVSRAEELTQFEDRTLFNERNSRIYAWRLAC